MGKTFAIAANTFRETIRDRILGVIVLFALAMIVASLWLASISLGQEARMMKDFGLLAVTAFGLVVAVFVAGSLVHKEVDKRTVFVLFSKPVGRIEFIWGKFLGLCLTMLVVVAGMGLFLFMVVWIVAGERSLVVLVATALIFVELVVVMAVTMLFSTFTSAILASVLGICVFVAGQLSHNVLSLTRLGESALTKALSQAVFFLVPNLSAVDVKPVAVGEGDLDWALIGGWTAYLAGYTVLALLLASWFFKRKEF